MDYPLKSSRYDLRNFLEKIKDKDYHEIMKATDEEIYRVEKLSHGRPGAVRARKLGSVKYINKLKEFLFFMGNGVKPATVFDSDFQLYKIVVKPLVNKGQFKPKILDYFD